MWVIEILVRTETLRVSFGPGEDVGRVRVSGYEPKGTPTLGGSSFSSKGGR